MLQVIKEAAITHTNDCDSALQSAHDLPSSAVSNQLANHMTELDAIIRECGNTAKRLSVVNASLKDWTAANIALQQVMNNRTNSLNAVNTLASSDAFMIENRLSKSKVCRCTCVLCLVVTTVWSALEMNNVVLFLV